MDGSFGAGEWDDAIKIEMVYPDFCLPPFKGTVCPQYKWQSGPPDDADDGSLIVYLKWDDTYLYMAYEFHDDELAPTFNRFGRRFNRLFVFKGP